MEAAAAPPLYLDDLAVGQTFEPEVRRTLEAESIKAFAREFDPQPFHVDEVAARTSVFEGLAASGWQVASTTMRLLVDGGMPIAGGLVGAAAELEWPRPTRPGDTLRVRSEIVAVTPSRSKPDRGIVTIHVETLNQRDEVVQTMASRLMVRRRPV